MSTTPASVYFIPRAVLGDWFGDCRAYLEEACKIHPFLDIDDVYFLCAQGVLLLSIQTSETGRVRGCCVTEFVNYPKHRVINIVLCGGEPGFLENGFGELLGEIERRAKGLGATAIAAIGRVGWEKVAPTYGWHSKALRTLWKEISHVEGRRNSENH